MERAAFLWRLFGGLMVPGFFRPDTRRPHAAPPALRWELGHGTFEQGLDAAVVTVPNMVTVQFLLIAPLDAHDLTVPPVTPAYERASPNSFRVVDKHGGVDYVRPFDWAAYGA